MSWNYIAKKLQSQHVLSLNTMICMGCFEWIFMEAWLPSARLWNLIPMKFPEYGSWPSFDLYATCTCISALYRRLVPVWYGTGLISLSILPCGLMAYDKVLTNHILLLAGWLLSLLMCRVISKLLFHFSYGAQLHVYCACVTTCCISQHSQAHGTYMYICHIWIYVSCSHMTVLYWSHDYSVLVTWLHSSHIHVHVFAGFFHSLAVLISLQMLVYSLLRCLAISVSSSLACNKSVPSSIQYLLPSPSGKPHPSN